MSWNAVRKRPAPATRYRPAVERLEDRCLLAQGSFAVQPIVPIVDYTMQARLRAELIAGLQRGNRANVFAKIGDSITAGAPFLFGIGSPQFDPANTALVGAHTNLAATIDYFRTVPVDGTGADSFNRVTAAAYPGWTTANVLSGPMAVEYGITRPAFALIMLGTNDLVGESDGIAFRSRLATIVQATLNAGVIPVLSTIPDHLFAGGLYGARVPIFNQAIADVAAQMQMPLWNYWLAMQPLVNKGISSDGVHPTSDPFGSWIFTDDGLQFGYNVRNLTAIEVLDKLKRVVVDNGVPDCPDRPLSADTVQFVVGTLEATLNRVPSLADLNYWGQPLECGVARQDVVQGIWHSIEHRSLELGQYYATYLHRTPGVAEWSYWMDAFQAGASERDVQQAMLNSPEYQANPSSAGAYIDSLYQDVLGYSPSDADQAYWQQTLQEGLSRPALASIVLSSAEAARNVILHQYGNLLKRFAAPSEEQTWISWLQQGITSEEIIAEAILLSPEFAQRVGS